ncbi:MAG: sulfite exporter TauE/SafE family protein [Betaproteobacteria bacterium]
MLDCAIPFAALLSVPFHWLPDVSWQVLAALPILIFAAYTVFGATGFGSSVIAVPALAHAFPLTFAVPLVTVLDCAATTTASFRQWRHARLDEFLRLLPTALIGIVAGTTLLVRLPRAPALLALGVFVLSYGIYILAGPRQRSTLHRRWAWPIGLAGGAFSVLFGTGGPIYMVYLSARIHDKSELRATSSLMITSSVLMRAAVFISSGLMFQDTLLPTAALLAPAMVLGYVAGNRLHHALSRNGVMKLIASLLVANGMLLIGRAMAMWHAE